MRRGALSDVKVVELAEFISGPYAAKMFADMGAEVIKVERPNVGDVTRRLGPFPNDVPHPERSGQFRYLNSNKLGVTLNTNVATGVKILKELLSQADVFIESNPRRTMKKLELDPNSLLTKVNPRLVVTSISPWGHTGPYRDYKGYDISITAASNVSCRLGFRDQEPLQMPAYQGSYYAGVNAAAATMAALYARDMGGLGRGQHVDISQIACFATQFTLQATIFLHEQGVSIRTGRQMPGVYPYTTLRCKDGSVLLASLEEKHWQSILEAMGNPEWANDPRFATVRSRYPHRHELNTLIESWLVSHTVADLIRLWKETKGTVAMSPFLSVAELVRSEHLEEREFFVEINHPVAGKLKCPGAPYKLSETPWEMRYPAPLLGQHNEEIYCGRLDYSKDELVQLHATAII